jgi:hypothetical protein
LLGFEADIADNEDERQQVDRHIPESAAWVCCHLNHKRAVGPVQKKQWQFFEQHYTRFQHNEGRLTADNYSFINWSSFADFWNKTVDEDDELDQPKYPELTYKNATILQKAWKKYQKRSNRATTMLGKTDASDSLSARHRVPQTENIPAAATPLPRASGASGSAAATGAQDLQSSQTRPLVAAFIGADPSAIPARHSDVTAASRPKKRKRTGQNKPHRCRTCGHPYRSEEWKAFHETPATAIPSNLLNQRGFEAWHYCTVPQEQRVHGFPVAEGQKLPRTRF